MTEKPILFSGPMVRAILDGRKRQTRRVLKWQPVLQDGKWLWTSGTMGFHAYEVGSDGFWACKPTHVVGDRLWVREAWAPGDNGPIFRADGDANRYVFGGWKPSIHMPRWASRLTLLVTDVRVQRLHDISEEDARAEGIYWSKAWGGWTSGAGVDETCDFHAARATEAFRKLWERINGDDSWNANPWVAAYTFEVLP